MTEPHSHTRTILALDLSMNSTGYAVVDIVDGTLKLIEKGILTGTSCESHGKRLYRQYKALEELADKYNELIVVKESLHYGRVKTSAILAKVHGMVDLLFNEETIHEYPAVTIKKEVALNGKATKKEVKDAVIRILAEHGIMDVEFKTDDESDAVAVALTYLLKEGEH